MNDLQKKINNVYLGAFGRTPLRQRLEDIQKEVTELCRYIDLTNLKEETGDALTSIIQLANEAGWTIDELVEANLEKIVKRQVQYKSLGRKIRVAILGGAFDPVTNGHIASAQFVLNVSRIFDEVWLMPCYSHLYGKEMQSPEDRLNMCKLAAKIDGRIRVVNYEIENKFSGETYHLVKQLLEEDFAKDQYEFSLIIGMDNANTFDKWVNYQDLERMIQFVVVHRLGVKRDEKVNWYLKPPHIYLPEEKSSGMIDISSTQIRNALSYPVYHEEAKIHLNTKVLEYIKEKKLYMKANIK